MLLWLSALTTPVSLTRRRAAALSRQLAFTAGLCTLTLPGCATPPPPPPPVAPVVAEAAPVQCEDSIFQRASKQQTSYFQAEAKRLETDLREAEAAMIAIESGMRTPRSRADTVSVLAEARIAVEHAARSVPWRAAEAADARAKLEEAEKQLQADHLGTAVFFASRARRIADRLNEEADLVAANPGTRFIRGTRVNLRSGPSTRDEILGVLHDETPVLPERLEGSWWLIRTLPGQVGWVHAKLLR